MTTTGPPKRSRAATEFAMRSAPTSRGFSVRIGIPVLTPGSMTTGLKPKYFSVISRNAAVALGTTEEMAMPSMSSSNENPWKPRNSWTCRACSSLVRCRLVEMRQWSRRPRSHSPVLETRFRSAPRPSSSSPNRPMTVCVLPTSMAKSIGTACPARPARSQPATRRITGVDDGSLVRMRRPPHPRWRSPRPRRRHVHDRRHPGLVEPAAAAAALADERPRGRRPCGRGLVQRPRRHAEDHRRDARTPRLHRVPLGLRHPLPAGEGVRGEPGDPRDRGRHAGPLNVMARLDLGAGLVVFPDLVPLLDEIGDRADVYE